MLSGKGVLRTALILTTMAVIIFTALFLMWWNAFFLPGDLKWREYETAYDDGRIELKNKRVCFTGDDIVWKSDRGVFVQDMLIRDIDRDGREELVMLCWKHGSFGHHIPRWVKRNDIRLEQHVFIYRRETDTIRPLWMSSSIGSGFCSMAGWGDDKIILNSRKGDHDIWTWEDFGLKLAGRSKEEKVSVVCAGDNLVHTRLLNDDRYKQVYDRLKDTISGADIATVNQETVLVADPALVSDHPRFALPAKIAYDLADTGFDVITLANNHMLDLGMYGVDSTAGIIEDAFNETGTDTAVSKRIYTGINPSSGVSGDKAQEDMYRAVKFTSCRGIRIACLSYTYGTNGMKEPKESPYAVEKLENTERVAEQIRYARPRADVVMVFPHWGDENSSEVSKEQERLARFFLDAGCDVVVGTHPHVVQKYEILKDPKGREMPVFYSLGNFVSGQSEEANRIGGLAGFDLVKEADGEVCIKDPELSCFDICFE